MNVREDEQGKAEQSSERKQLTGVSTPWSCPAWRSDEGAPTIGSGFPPSLSRLCQTTRNPSNQQRSKKTNREK